MAYNSNFDVDAVMGVLGTIGARFEDGTPEDEALRIAAVALLYVRENGKLEDYREYFRRFFIPATESVVVARSFSTPEEADAWLAQGLGHEGDLVRVAGKGFRVIPRRKGGGLMFLRTPLPEEMEP
ncbi:MAG: hypothetical protein EOP83_34185 [Verrucomicrobiaceae bacterium]|uniref:Uncharacterized protein n=1 Tax=Corallococcus coralloides TaxID=184914 RepID=A0A410RQN8_CORCK|nr:hypothetical protein [Corallococcus coralloides]QAT84210.1 hypothetical protein EJ065_2638 [Corallococcus coralloides]RYD41223.1 MAG: hypothetical protein EOP83_34185 [Verrucomicrobiaceae bacterium]